MFLKFSQSNIALTRILKKSCVLGSYTSNTVQVWCFKHSKQLSTECFFSLRH